MSGRTFTPEQKADGAKPKPKGKSAKLKRAMGKRHGPEVKAAFMKDLAAGATIKEAAKKYGISEVTGYAWRASHGKPRKPGRQGMPVDEEIRRQAVAELAESTGAEVAKKYGVSAASLYTWRKEFNATTKKRGTRALNGAAVNGVDASEADAGMKGRVNKAIQLLRLAYKEVKRMESEGKLNGADKAHSYAYLALLELQGDNGL